MEKALHIGTTALVDIYVSGLTSMCGFFSSLMSCAAERTCGNERNPYQCAFVTGDGAVKQVLLLFYSQRWSECLVVKELYPTPPPHRRHLNLSLADPDR